MPIYEYQCQACGHRHDHLQRLSDPDPSDCPACSAPQLKRRVSAPSFRLSGSGWYETDFKSDKEKKRNLAGDGADTGEKAKPAAEGAAAKSSEAPAAAAPKSAGDSSTGSSAGSSSSAAAS